MMTRIAHRGLALSALIMVVTAPAAALAAGGHGFQFNVHGYYVIDFLVLVAIIWWFARKPAQAFLQRRHDAVKAEMEQATALRREAEARLARYSEMLAGLETEIAEIREKFRRDGEVDRQRVLDEARATSERLQRDAERQLRSEVLKLKESVERELLDAALERAEAQLRERMTPDAQRDLVRGFIADLESKPSLTRLSA